MKPITAILIGAGGRGTLAYAPYLEAHPEVIRLTGVAEPNDDRREALADRFNMAADMRFARWQDIGQRRLADACIICTNDKHHFGPAMWALGAGYHVLLEKPMSPDAAECIAMGDEALGRPGQVFSICHVLRYTPFFSTIKALLEDGRIGDVTQMVHAENVAYWHQAHSYVRGSWGRAETTSPMILAKSCHDMDLMLWLMGKPCLAVSSFGSLKHFRPDCAPQGAPHYCLDGCPEEETCPYYAPRCYTRPGWPTANVTGEFTPQAIRAALKRGPYGRCVYHCDNDVVDHQVVAMAFEGGAAATFSMCAFTQRCDRTLKIMGTKGEIRAHAELPDIEVRDFHGHTQSIPVPQGEGGHGGGDGGLLQDFARLVREGGQGRTGAAVSVQSHLMALAAEASRVEGRTVTLEAFEQRFR